MTGAPREAYASQDFIIVRKTAVRELGSWELAGCFQRIAWRSERDGFWRATMAEIADDICLSERTAKRLTTKLRELGWITAERENTWESTLTWRVVWQDESANLAPSDEDDETAGQAPEGQDVTDESANVELSEDPDEALPAQAKLAPSQSANLAPSPFPQTDNTNYETAGDSLRSSPAESGNQPALIGLTGGASSTRATGNKPKADKSPFYAQAETIGRAWWEHYQATYGQITRVGSGNPFIALVKNVILPALESDWTENEIKFALARPATQDGIPDAVPDKQRFQRALVAVRTGVPAVGQRALTNAHHVPETDLDRQARSHAF